MFIHAHMTAWGIYLGPRLMAGNCPTEIEGLVYLSVSVSLTLIMSSRRMQHAISVMNKVNVVVASFM